MKSYWAAVLIPLLVACGPNDKNRDGIIDGVRDPSTVTLIAPSTPTGTISGQVLDTGLRPLEGVIVSLSAAGLALADGGTLSTTSDSAGNWSFSGIPAGGEILVYLSKSGYATVRTTATIPSSTGDVPMSNANANVGPFALTQTNSTLKFLVITSTGRPAKGAQARLEVTPAATLVTSNSTYGTNRGIVIADTVADDTGMLTFSGVPGPEEISRLSGNYTVTIAALDLTGDGIPESAGTEVSYTGQALLIDNTTPVIRLPDGRSGLGDFRLLSTNVPSFNTGAGGSPPTENMLKPSDPIYMVFSHLLLPSSISIRLTDEAALQSLPVTHNIAAGSVLTITPGSPLQLGKEYNIAVHAVSLDTGEVYDGLAYYFGGDPTTPVPIDVTSIQFRDSATSDGLLNSGETVEVNFNQPVAVSGTGTSVLSIIYFNRDLNGDNNQGNFNGEWKSDGTYNTNPGFTLSSDEYKGGTTSLFTLKKSGYTTRWAFRYPDSGTIPAVVSPTTEVYIQFSRFKDTTSNIQTIWGVPLLADLHEPLTFTSSVAAP